VEDTLSLAPPFPNDTFPDRRVQFAQYRAGRPEAAAVIVGLWTPPGSPPSQTAPSLSRARSRSWPRTAGSWRYPPGRTVDRRKSLSCAVVEGLRPNRFV